MSYLIEWDSICRICLQEGDLRPIFDGEEDFSPKIMLCSSIEMRKGTNLPEQICDTCFMDLETAYKFRTNCESSEAILNSLITDKRQSDEVVFSTDSGDIYKFRAPPNLKVKRIKTKVPIVNVSDESLTEHENEVETGIALYEQNTEYDGAAGDESVIGDSETVFYVEDITENELEQYDPLDKETVDSEDIPKINHLTNITTTDSETEQPIQIQEYKSVSRPPNKFIPKLQTDMTQFETAEIITKENGKKVYRVKRMFKEETKPLKVCKLCGNQYKFQHALDSHMRRHNNEKPFKCDVCGKGFVINFELNRHKRIHSGEKPYKCQYCDRRFSDFGSRIKHERTHTGERPYKCQICGKAFAYSHVLNSHNLIHTGEKKYHCDICGKRFAKAHHLKAHLNIHEKNKTGKASNSKMAEPRYYKDVMKVVTPSVSRLPTVDDADIHVIQESGIIDGENLTILTTDDEIDCKEGISMIFEDGTIVQS